MVKKHRMILILVLILALAVCLSACGDKKSDPGNDTGKMIANVQDLNGMRIGVQTGSTFDATVRRVLPDAKIYYFSTLSDFSAALESNKIDAFTGDEPVLRMMAAENDKLAILEEHLDSFDFGFLLPKTAKGEKLRDELNEWIASMNESGELDQVIQIWINGTEEEKTVPDYSSLPAVNGTLKMASDGTYPPMNYYRGNKIVGIEIDLAARFCEAYGYGLVIETINFDGILPSIQSGKADFAADAVAITEERGESVLFSDPYYQSGTMMAVLKTELLAGGNSSFLEGLKSSFTKTFLREDRWKLFAKGTLNTLLITILTILFGTALGFLVYMLCRNGNRIANGITGFAVWLVQGMPAVVLLMILFYIFFGSISISGVVVSIIAFTLTFGATVIGLLEMGVGAVDKGQYEAACALGHTDLRTFFLIILPQALLHILPAYKGEIVSLIKATSIVGYIAVQDLTKMGDIVRSRTYEAFFPLITVTIIYFLMEGVFRWLITKIDVSIDPQKRKPEKILKGIKIDDQDEIFPGLQSGENPEGGDD